MTIVQSYFTDELKNLEGFKAFYSLVVTFSLSFSFLLIL